MLQSHGYAGGRLAAMNLQHVNVKLLIEDFGDAGLERLIPVFHGWIQDRARPELLLDIADYRHVPAGSGVVLIGHEANYSVDNTDNRMGVRYNRKAELDGSNRERLAQAAVAALSACQLLEAEPRLQNGLRFNGQEIEIFINDRLLVPNVEATREALHGELESFFRQVFRNGEISMSYDKDPRHLFGVSVKAARRFPVADLLANLSGRD